MVLARMNRRRSSGYFRKVIELEPKSSGAHLNLDRAGDQFNLVDALVEFSEACASMATQLRPITTRVECCWICGAMQRQNLSSKLLRVSNRSMEKRVSARLIEKAAGNATVSVQMLKKAAAIYPEDVDTCSYSARNLRVLATRRSHCPMAKGHRT